MQLDTQTSKNTRIILFLFAIQFVFIFTAENRWQINFYTPFLLQATCLILAGYFIYIQKQQTHIKNTDINISISPWRKILYFFTGTFTVALSYEEVRKLFARYPNASTLSDVMPQLDTQYDRFSHGIFPYSPVTSVPWQPYPVYMPLHWLPVGISRVLNIDTRWSGFIILAIAAGLYGYVILQRKAPTGLKIIALLLPSIVLWAYIVWGGIDIPAVLETLISAYYLVLAIGLMSKNLVITTIGIILCLLSRYTLVFWLPIFLILLWQNLSPRKNFVVWLSIIAAITFVYLLPFLSKDHTVFLHGLVYHNGCAYNCWNDFMNNKYNSSYYSGLFFAPRLYDIFPGTIEHKVFLARAVQGGVMLFLLGVYLAIYRKVKEEINFYHYCLAALYVSVFIFMLFSPLIFKYYYMPVLTISAVMCAQAIISNAKS